MQEELISIGKDLNEKVAHLLTQREQWAIRAAVAANRPLLVEGEPGTGKTQLAIAAAKWLKRKLVSMVVDSKSEARDALWSFDAVERLAHAQLLSSLSSTKQSATKVRQVIEKELALDRFVRPGPMWWGLNWDKAKMRLGSHESLPDPSMTEWNDESGGVVVLIDEIDKADRDFPNGLLEVFGSRSFMPPGYSEPIEASTVRESPLMIITTNHERDLPSAFERRCLKFRLDPPPVLSPSGQELSEQEQQPFLSYLTDRGSLHFPDLDAALILKAAQKIMEFRIDSFKRHEPQKSGLAEYLDLLRTLTRITDHSAEAVLKEVGELYRK
jgi:MoxR-like ATPase